MAALAEKNIKTRMQQKHDVEANWVNVDDDFIPLAGEIIIYDADESNLKPRIKIGDGTTILSELDFIGGSLEDIINGGTW